MSDDPNAAHPGVDTLLTEAQVAGLLNVRPGTVQVWRTKGTGPRFYKLPSIRYGRADVEEWLSTRLVRPSDEEARA